MQSKWRRRRKKMPNPVLPAEDRKYIMKRTNLRYVDVGHGAGAVIWWVDNAGRIRTFVSTGKEFHHELNRKMDMDLRWRGRLEKTTGRTSLLPPIGTKPIHEDYDVLMAIPRKLMTGLKKMGGHSFMCVVNDRLWTVSGWGIGHRVNGEVMAEDCSIDELYELAIKGIMKRFGWTRKEAEKEASIW